MDILYNSMLVTHVLVAVLGLGSIASVAIVAATALSLAAMLATGVLLDLMVGGAFRGAWWFRGSALLLVATGLLQAQARPAVGRDLANEDDGALVLRRVECIAYGMCALIGVIAVLMEVKPF